MKRFEATLATGTHVSVTLEEGKVTVQRKVKVQHANGKWHGVKGMTAPVKYNGFIITVIIQNITLIGKSCCKPPDTYNHKTGKRRAIRHLFLGDINNVLTGPERGELFQLVVRNGKRQVQ